MTLSSDYARCHGVGDDVAGWREGCEHCLRRTSQHDKYSSWIEPPPIIVFWCEYLIEQGEIKQ